MNKYKEMLKSFEEEYGSDILESVLDKFKKQYENYKNDFKELKEKEIKEVKLYIHKLKGTTSSMYLKKISKKCEEIEEKIEKGEDFIELLVELEEEMDIFLELI